MQRQLLAQYHVDDPMTFFSTSDFWDVPLDPNPTASSYQPPYYIVAKDLAAEDNSASFQLTSAMNRFRRDFLAAYISASSDPGHLRQAHGADHPRPGQRAEAGVQRDQHRHRGQSGPRCHRPGQPEPNTVGQPAHAAGGPGRIALRRTGVRLAGCQRRRVVVPATDPGGDDVQRQGRLRADGARRAHRVVRAGCRCDRHRTRSDRGAAAVSRPARSRPRAGSRLRDSRRQVRRCRRYPRRWRRRPVGSVQLSGAKAAALQEVNTALDDLRQAQESGNFGQYGEALQRLDDAMKKYQSAG